MNKQEGIITKSTGSWYDIEDNNGYTHKGRLKGKFKIKELKVTNPIAVGDIVNFEIEATAEKSVVITNIQPRKNYLIRKSVHKTEHGHLIACNIDQSLLVITLGQPKTSIGFIDRFLISCETFRIPPLLVFNKMDLIESEDDKEFCEAVIYLYESIGYQCHKTSTVTGEGIEELKELLKNKKTVFSGHSGAGKSTLINKLIPDLNLRTSEISDFAQKGKHTTTFAEMFHLDQKSYIIDTPGIKELGLFDIEREELSHYFPEMRQQLGNCKFHNCLHLKEPQCAIRQAVDSEEIPFTRYESYLSIMEDEDNRK